jgi:putative membrane protein
MIKWFLYSLAVYWGAMLIPGVGVESFVVSLLVALVLGLLNYTAKPLLIFLTLPITILTLGLFLLVVNALIIWLAGAIVPGFVVTGFWDAFFFAIVLSAITTLLEMLFGIEE